MSSSGSIGATHRPQSSSFLGLPYRILNMNPKRELLWGLWLESIYINININININIYIYIYIYRGSAVGALFSGCRRAQGSCASLRGFEFLTEPLNPKP